MNQTSEKKLANAGKPPPDDTNDAVDKPPWLPHQDRGYAWVVCAASFFSHVAQCGVLYSMGMFYIVFRENMQGGSSAISLVSSINAGTAFFTGMLFEYLKLTPHTHLNKLYNTYTCSYKHTQMYTTTDTITIMWDLGGTHTHIHINTSDMVFFSCFF